MRVKAVDRVDAEALERSLRDCLDVLGPAAQNRWRATVRGDTPAKCPVPRDDASVAIEQGAKTATKEPSAAGNA